MEQIVSSISNDEYTPFMLHALSPHHQLIRLLQILRRNRAIELPGDVHRAGTVVLDVTRRAKVGVGGGAAVEVVGFEFADEETDPAASRLMMDISLASW